MSLVPGFVDFHFSRLARGGTAMDVHARGRSRTRASSELAEIESELLKNQLEAVLIGRLVEEFGVALRADATQIVFHGDRIAYHKPGAGGVRPSVLDVAKVRQIGRAHV